MCPYAHTKTSYLKLSKLIFYAIQFCFSAKNRSMIESD